MKTKTFTALCALFSGLLLLAAGTINSNAALIAYDPYLSGNIPAGGEYANGASLQGSSPTVMGFSGTWIEVGNDTHPNEARTQSTGLSHVLVDSAGGSLFTDNAHNSIVRSLSTGAITGTELWVSFLGRIDEGGRSNTQVAALILTAGGGEELQFGLRDDNGGLGGHFLSGPGQVGGTAQLTVGTTYLQLLRIVDEGGTAGNDEITLYTFDGVGGDTLSDLATADGTITMTGSEFWDSGESLASARWHFSAVAMGFDDYTVDELRIGTTLDSVGLVPEPSRALLSFVGIAAIGLRRRRN